MRQQVRPLTYRQKLFCRNYLSHGNGARAVRESGYEKTNAAQSAYALMKIPVVAAELAKAQAQVMERLEIKAEKVHEIAAARPVPRMLGKLG